MLQSANEYAKRRKALLEQIGSGSIAIVTSANEYLRNGDSHFPFRQDSDFYYLTGFKEPEAVAVFIPGRKEGEFVLFNRSRDPAKELWDGIRAGQEGACSIYGADQAFPISALHEELPKLLENRDRLYYPINRDTEFNRQIFVWVKQVQTKIRSGIKAPHEFLSIENILSEMRLIKSPFELALMRRAAEISALAHCRAMAATTPGKMEYELEAEVLYVFTKKGSRAPAYNNIVCSGANTCILHYNDNNAKISDGDLILIDAAAEYECYAADITRTYPANGVFTLEQRAVYEVVLAAQVAVIDAVKPGVAWNLLQEISEQVVTEGLVKLGLLSGEVSDLLAKKACRKFYMHHIGHWLGLDVHDVGAYQIAGKPRVLQAGMVFTVEPGIYIPAESEGVDPKWWNIGVRIEDDIVVTKEGSDVLTAGVPKTVEAIEHLMRDKFPTHPAHIIQGDSE
ncbi:MAG TPA: Xaa-Pro aminopeptidase [Gammaproteobacteria bacterium]|nr:Xaa-Pro aminopeptidase [Gammaproteobacteria bacterium]